MPVTAVGVRRGAVARLTCVLVLLSLGTACDRGCEGAHGTVTVADAAIRADASRVTSAALRAAETNRGDWLTHGRTYSEQRYSLLDQVKPENVGHLALEWTFQFDTTRRMIGTPLVANGVMYASGPWSVVWALDAATGTVLWSYDPGVPRSMAWKGCCDVVNHGVALHENKVFIATFDGRLVALDQSNGRVLWSTLTVDQSKPYTITGAPRVADGKVLIGNGGAEFGVRGYVSAYDVETGTLVWRVYTVPGDPRQSFESPAMEAAAKTWTGEWWKAGGGGTVWDAIAYDPELGLVYVGTGNGGPWNARFRSPDGGDNLYLSSILALRIATGEQVWYYQETPGDIWDYTATQQITLADVEIAGQKRKVLLQAPKNGFLYVLDRETGRLISAAKFADEVTWASSIDLATGRPVINPAARYVGMDGGVVVQPSVEGAHSIQPMAFSPKDGLVFVPMQNNAFYFADDRDWVWPGKASWNVGTKAPGEFDGVPSTGTRSRFLLAWDPVQQKEKWRVKVGRNQGGAVATAGGLVFQQSDHRFHAYRSDNGDQVWSTPLPSTAPGTVITYAVKGRQYVTVTGGNSRRGGSGAITTYALDGTARPTMPAAPELPQAVKDAGPPSAEVRVGARAFARYCLRCHGAPAFATAPVLWGRDWSQEDFERILLGGSASELGMPSFAGVIPKGTEKDLLAYIRFKRLQVDHRRRGD